jgi:superfamily II DNA or RNA helicase
MKYMFILKKSLIFLKSRGKIKNQRFLILLVHNIIKDKFFNCWLWNDTPNDVLSQLGFKINCDDIGCDIVCQNHDLSFLFIQCKNYSTTGCDNTISIHDLSGFYNFIAETGYNGVVYYSGKLSSQILCRKRKINYINLPFINNNLILDFKPRDYQIEAYNIIKDNNKSLLLMPCGTGKTFVSFLLSLEYKNIIILSPLISTSEQLMTHYKNYSSCKERIRPKGYYSKYNDINFILVNCKAVRKIDDILLKNKNIISSTYDSCDIINKIINKLNNVLIIIDECHNLTDNNQEIKNLILTDNNQEINNLILTNHKILYMSATPTNNIKYENKYELSWDDAIKYKYICDYNFYYPNNDKIIEVIDNLKIDKNLIEKTILINKAYFLLESIKLTNIKKCIVYLKTINESNEFIKILQTLNIYFEFNIKVYEINYKTTSKNREKTMTKFKNDNTCINIICNVHILDEGIDIPECDAVYLTHPNNNPVNIIQRISRSNRLDVNNKEKKAKVFLWCKNEIKLGQIINNLSTYIKIIYGNETNDIINFKNKNNNILNKEINNTIIDIYNKTLFYNKFEIKFILDTDNLLWFKFSDIASILEYKDRNDVLKKHVDKKYRKHIKNIETKHNIEKQKPDTVYITECGLYKLLIKSCMKKADEFKE